MGMLYPCHRVKTIQYQHIQTNKVKNYKLMLMMCAVASLAACGNNHQEGEDELAHHHHSHAEGGAEEFHSEITLREDAQKMFGVESEVVSPSTFNNVINVSGQIAAAPGSASMVSAPTSGIVHFASSIAPGREVSPGATIATVSAESVAGGNANAVAKAELDRAKKELDRIEPLYAEKLVTAQAYNDAKAAYQAAKSAYSPSAASGACRAVKGGVITEILVSEGQYVDAGTPIAAISSTRTLTLRADVPERYGNNLHDIYTCNIELGNGGQTLSLADMHCRRISGAQLASSTRGYVPLYFEFDNNGSVIPGSFVKVYLLGTPREGVISVPKEALSEQQGQMFVYKRLDEDCFAKLPVQVGQNDGSKVEIKSGLAGGEDIVVRGTTAVRIAESSGAVPEGHSHNH